ncbi:Uncharacterised protein [Mycobacteroides abscessus]|nr:Uncharacterised protein [Mycobacteroides abscessus]
MRSLLEGAARSVSLDHRQRIKVRYPNETRQRSRFVDNGPRPGAGSFGGGAGSERRGVVVAGRRLLAAPGCEFHRCDAGGLDVAGLWRGRACRGRGGTAGCRPGESHRAAVGVGAAPACGFAAAVGIGALAQAMVAGQPPRGRRPIGSGSAGCRGSGADRDGRGLFHRRHPGCRCCRTPGTPCGGAGLSSRPAGRPACGTLSGLGRRDGSSVGCAGRRGGTARGLCVGRRGR